MHTGLLRSPGGPLEDCEDVAYQELMKMSGFAAAF